MAPLPAPSASTAPSWAPVPTLGPSARFDAGNGRPWATVLDLSTLRMGWSGDWTVPPASELPAQVLVVPRDLVAVGIKELDRKFGIMRFVDKGAHSLYPWYLFIVQFDEKKLKKVTECGFFAPVEESDPERPFRIGYCVNKKGEAHPAKIYFEQNKEDSELLLISVSVHVEKGFRYDEEHRPAKW